MTHSDERGLYLTDRAAWARYVGPRWVEMMKKGSEAEKKKLWAIAGPELRAEMRRLKEAQSGAVAL